MGATEQSPSLKRVNRELSGTGQVIDAHVHVWEPEQQPWTAQFPALQRSFRLEQLDALAAAHGIDGFVVVQAGDTPAETATLLQAAAQEPLVVGVVGWAALERSDIDRQLTELSELPGATKLVGLRHQLQLDADPRWITRLGVRDGLRRLARAGICYDIVASPQQLKAVIETVRLLPELRFVLDHAGKPPVASGDLGCWRRELSALARCENVAVKLSGLVTEADHAGWTQAQIDPVIAHVMDCFGPSRTMLGSDWPVCLLAADYATVQSTTSDLLYRLDQPDRSALLGMTAIRWYGIERP